jgi:hypothetical protein
LGAVSEDLGFDASPQPTAKMNANPKRMVWRQRNMENLIQKKRMPPSAGGGRNYCPRRLQLTT